MIPGYIEFKKELHEKKIKMVNPNFKNVVNKFDLFHFPGDEKLNKEQILKYIQTSEFIVIDTYTYDKTEYVIACIKRNIIFIKKSEQDIINAFLSHNKVYFIPNKQNSLQNTVKFTKEKPDEMNKFNDEFYSFKENFYDRGVNRRKMSKIMFYDISKNKYDN